MADFLILFQALLFQFLHTPKTQFMLLQTSPSPELCIQYSCRTHKGHTILCMLSPALKSEVYRVL